MKNNHLCSVFNNEFEKMSNNIVNTIGHHACKSADNKYLLNNAPFRSEYTETTEEGKEPFLGEGYYMWDYNLETAHWWGRNHYNNKYAILSYPLTLSGEKFLDLVGSRQDMEIFKTLMDKVNSKQGCTGFGIAKSIRMLEILNAMCSRGGVFDYKIIRAVDITENAASEIYGFAGKRDSKTNLNPKILICFKDKNDIPLRKARVVCNNL